MNYIQVQVITKPERRELYFKCRESLSGEPVNVTESVYGPYMENRLAFIESATAPFVSFVDDDDMVMAGVYDKLLSAVTTKHVGAHGHEVKVAEDGSIITGLLGFNTAYTLDGLLTRLHFPRPTIVRTDVAKTAVAFIRAQSQHVIDLLLPEAAILGLCGLCGDYAEVKGHGYFWRQHGDNMHRTQPDAWQASTTRQLLLYAAKEMGAV